MANSKRRSPLPLVVAGVIVAALAIWLGDPGFRVGRCSNDDFGTRHHRDTGDHDRTYQHRRADHHLVTNHDGAHHDVRAHHHFP